MTRRKKSKKKLTKREQWKKDGIVFFDHVPEGMEPCPICCKGQSGLAAMPGYFRDFDVDLSLSKFGPCFHCAGTGVEMNLAQEDTSFVLDLRKIRYGLALDLGKLQKEYHFSLVLLAGKKEIEPYLERAVHWLESIREGDQGPEVASIRLGLRVLDLLLRYDSQDGYDATFISDLVQDCECHRNQKTGKNILIINDCACQQMRRLLIEARDIIDYLFPEQDAEKDGQFTELVREQVARLAQEIDDIKDRLAQPFLFKEIILILKVHEKWVEAGRPKGCYAENMIEALRGYLVPKPRRVFSEEWLEKFEPEEMPTELDGLNAHLLADLHDLVMKFGRESPTESVRRLSMAAPKEVHICVSTLSDNLNMIIIGSGGMSSPQGSHPITLPNSRSLVIWDKQLTVEDIEVFIEFVDRLAKEHGLVDADTDRRRQIQEEELETPRFSVDRIFKDKNVCMLVLPGRDSEQMRQQFDRPEEVAIYTSSMNIVSLIHRDSLDYFEAKDKFAQKYCQENNIPLEELGNMSLDQVFELRDKIDQAFRKTQN